MTASVHAGTIRRVMEFKHDALVAARQEKGMTQTLLAGLAGVSVDTVRRCEAGTVDPVGSNVAAMARALGITMDSLYAEVSA